MKTKYLVMLAVLLIGATCVFAEVDNAHSFGSWFGYVTHTSFAGHADAAQTVWLEQNEDVLALMVSTTKETYNIEVDVCFDHTCVGIKDIMITGPYEPLDGYGWSQHLNCARISLTNGVGVSPGEYTVALIALECIGGNCATPINLTVASPTNATVSGVTFVCATDANDTMIGIGDCRGMTPTTLTIYNASNVGACEVMLLYDPTITNVVNVTQGAFDTMFANVQHANDGQVMIGALQLESRGVNGDVDMAHVFFESVGYGECDIALNNTMLFDASPGCAVIPHTVVDGRYFTPRIGDVDNDGEVGSLDVVYIMRHSLGFAGYETINVEIADVNGDDVVNLADMFYLVRYLFGNAGYETLG